MNKTIEELGINIVGGQILSRLLIRGNEKTVPEKFGVIVAKTVANGYIENESISYSEFRERPDERRITKEGDIVIKITPPFAAALITKENEGLIVSSFCMILNKIPNSISKEFLTAYLNSDNGRKQVEKNMSSSTIATLSISNLKNVRIPILNKEVQDEIGKTFLKYIKNIELTKKLLNLQKEKIECLIEKED